MNKDFLKEASLDASGFVLLSDVCPDVIQEIRYYSTYNFVGERINGYEEPIALLTEPAARALKVVSDKANIMGYRLKAFEAYRPVEASVHFMLWGINDLDQRMKPYFYPELDKEDIFKEGYIVKQSTHSRGSAVDVTLLDMTTGKELDMGSPFDYFDEISHPDSEEVTREQYENRMILRNLMVNNGFIPYECEWWHFMLEDEPYPNTYFNFIVRTSSVK